MSTNRGNFVFYIFFVSIFTSSLIFGLIFDTNKAHAQSSMTEAQIQEQEAKWRAELEATEKEIAKWQSILDTSKRGTASLERDSAVLQAKINEAKAFIKQRQVQIEQLTRDIRLKTKTIKTLEEKIALNKQSLASIIRQANEVDAYSLPEIILSNKNISAFFQDLDAYDSINKNVEVKLDEIRGLHTKTEEEKNILDKKRIAEADTKAKIEEEKKRVERDEIEKQKLIKINKTQEKSYSQVIAEKKTRAAQIRAALFALRDSASIPFGDALKYAEFSSAKTGVRPALILAILTQESNLGQNQGSCLLTDMETGDGAGKNTGTPFEKVMKSPRDTVPFKAITERLGKDWKSTPISCPPGVKWTTNRGFGGGMGPSQFIPSTWEGNGSNGIKTSVGGVLGISADEVNPWNPEHAIMATAIYMRDLGAAGGGYTAERNSACKYYSGRSCGPGGPANTFYGDQVMAKAQNIQVNMIEPLKDL